MHARLAKSNIISHSLFSFFDPYYRWGVRFISFIQSFWEKFPQKIITVKPLIAATFAAMAKWPLFRGGRYSEV